jgi:hypothetical protein
MRTNFWGLALFLVVACSPAAPETETKQPATPVAAQTPAANETRPVIESLAAPAPANAAQPFLFAHRQSMLLSWTEKKGERAAVRFARWQNGVWSEPRTIVERDDLFVNWADFPSIAADGNGALVAHWLRKSGAGKYAYDIEVAASADGGSTWGEPFLLNRDGKAAEHGFVSIEPRASGFGIAWLDGRAMAGEHEGHGGHGGGDMMLRYADLDASGRVSGETVLDPRTCECCTTGIATTDDGPVVVYRDRSPEEIRDIAVVRRTPSGWSEPGLVHADGWKIEGCPVNGPQADARGRRVVTAWFTSAGGSGRVFAAFSDDAGSTFSAPVRIDDATPLGRLDVLLLDDERALVAWLEQVGEGAEIRAKVVTRDGAAGPAVKVGDSSRSRASGFVRIAQAADGVWFAWNAPGDGGGIRLARGRF